MSRIHWFSLFQQFVLWLSMGILLIAGLCNLSGQWPIFGQWHIEPVTDSKMAPVLPIGALSIGRHPAPTDQIQTGQIVVFSEPNLPNQHLIRRIQRVVRSDSNPPRFILQSDADAKPEPWTLSVSQIKANHRYTIPLAGFGVSFARSWIGTLLLVMLPAVIIICHQLLSIYLTLRLVDGAPAAKAAEPEKPNETVTI